MSIRLIMRGDDFGSFHCANKAITDSAKVGMLKNTSLMVPTPAFEAGVPLLKEAKGLCMGLHITFTAEWTSPKWGPVLPPSKVPSLVDENGLFYPDISPVHQRGVNLDEAMAEIQAQLDKARGLGLNIEYVDEHMGISWIHPPNKPDQRLSGRLEEWAKKQKLVWHAPLGNRLPPVEEKGLSLKDNYLKAAAAAKPGTYLAVFHPAYDVPELQPVHTAKGKPGVVASDREKDTQLLCDKAFMQKMQDLGVEFIKYTEA